MLKVVGGFIIIISATVAAPSFVQFRLPSSNQSPRGSSGITFGAERPIVALVAVRNSETEPGESS